MTKFSSLYPVVPNDTPLQARLTFYNQLENAKADNKLVSAYNFFNNLRIDVEADVPQVKHHLVDRAMRKVTIGSFFYQPGEEDYSVYNCFEANHTMYQALKNLYPESNPQLMFVGDKDVANHAMAMFTHKGKTWVADPHYHNFREIKITDGKIKFPKINNEKKQQKPIRFDKLIHVTDKDLEDKIKKLRRPEGIYDYIYEGQIVATTECYGHHHSVMMYVEPKTNKLVYEMRQFADYNNKRLFARKLKYNPETNVKTDSMFSYTKPFWRKPKKGDSRKEKIGERRSAEEEIDFSPADVLFDFLYFVRKGRVQKGLDSFYADKNVNDRFKELVAPIKKDKSTKWKVQRNAFHFLKWHFGHEKNVDPLANTILPNNQSEWLPFIDNWFEVKNQKRRYEMFYANYIGLISLSVDMANLREEIMKHWRNSDGSKWVKPDRRKWTLKRMMEGTRGRITRNILGLEGRINQPEPSNLPSPTLEQLERTGILTQ